MRKRDWFETLTGFRECDATTVRSRLLVDGEWLVSAVNRARYRIGRLELASLGELRQRARSVPRSAGGLRVGAITGEARSLHQRPEFSGALFQVASQFNLLEMTSPSVAPEDGVSRYASDPTQGPACAIAAGAATIYRNYFVPVGEQIGQSRERQLDALADLGMALAELTQLDTPRLWSMRNGYALCSPEGLVAINSVLAGLTESQRDGLRSKLRIGLHWQVEVTDIEQHPRPVVSQAFCSAMPVAYSRVDATLWAPLAQLILEAAYEATLLAGALHATQGGSRRVLLTRVGGGAFGNPLQWIDRAISRAFEACRDLDLDVAWVAYRTPDEAMLRVIDRFGA